MMSTDGTQDLDLQRHDMINELSKVGREFNRLSAQQEMVIESRILYLLPALSWATFMLILKELPDFLDPFRQEYFKKHMLRYWVFKPKGYQEALIYLQAQLRAFLSQSSLYAVDDQALRRLASKRISLMEAIDRNRHLASAKSQELHDAEIDNILSHVGLKVGPRSYIISMVTEDVVDAVATVEELPVVEPIATDDRLGYFS